MDLDKPSTGLLVALELNDRPTEGLAFDFGFGTLRNLRALANHYPNRTQGFELDCSYISRAQEIVDCEKLPLTLVHTNVLNLELMPNTLAVVCIGISIYLSKTEFLEFLQKVWKALKINGVLHIEFATVRDCTKDDEFVIYTCYNYPDESYPNSYFHHCGYATCQYDHPGVFGYSVWEEKEAEDFVLSLGEARIICQDLCEWVQVLKYVGIEEEVEHRNRSFYNLTVQKVN